MSHNFSRIDWEHKSINEEAIKVLMCLHLEDPILMEWCLMTIVINSGCIVLCMYINPAFPCCWYLSIISTFNRVKIWKELYKWGQPCGCIIYNRFLWSDKLYDPDWCTVYGKLLSLPLFNKLECNTTMLNRCLRVVVWSLN